MRGFLKCFYGYGNLGDEILFWGVLDYIQHAYPEVDDLTVEVKDVEWMQARRSRNTDVMSDLKLATEFLSHRKLIKFVSISKNIADNRKYDLYFFGGGEVFAESRGFHGGRNYLLRYPWVIRRKRFVLLGGIETPTLSLQKLLYRIVLPRAKRIVCRDQVSYHDVKSYNPDHTFYLHDFAVPVVDKYRRYLHDHHINTLSSHDPYDIKPIRDLTGSQYLIVNMIASMNTDESYDRIAKVVEQYPDHQLVYVAASDDDIPFASRLMGAYPQMVMYHRKDHTLAQTLALFACASGGVACRLHILLLLQEFERDRYALVYAQKVEKLIRSTIEISKSSGE